MKKIIVAICMFNILCLYTPVHALTVKEGLDISLTSSTTITSKDVRDYSIQATIADDVIYKNTKIFKSGDKAILTLQDYKKAGAWGVGGKLLVANGYAYDTKGIKRKISFTKQIEGHDKNWVKGVCCCGIILWPLLLFGFVNGDEAKLMPKDTINAITMSSFEF